MKYSLLLCLLAVTALVSATNGHPSRGTKTFLARLNQNLNKVCAKMNSLEQENSRLSGAVSDLTQLVAQQSDIMNSLEQENTQLSGAVSDLTQLVAQQSDIISALEQRIEDIEGQNTPGTLLITRQFDFS